MKNYVVWHNCPIRENHNAFGLEAAGQPGVRDRYSEMHRISLASAYLNIGGTWQPRVFTEPADTRVQMFQHSWQRIRDLWHSEPCNILYLDSDTVVIRPVDIFGSYDTFRLFNHSTPPATDGFPHYFNAAVRYYPHTMTPECWAVGDAMAAAWDLNIWDQEQRIFNAMLWSQGLTFEQAFDPTLNYQAPTGGPDQVSAWDSFNQCSFDTVRIVHYHGTRSSNRGVEIAQALAHQHRILI